MRIKLIGFVFYIILILSNTVYGWSIWDLYQIYDDTEKKVLLENGYKMYEFRTLSELSQGTSYIAKHDVYYDWFRANLVLKETTLNREQVLRIGDYLKINYSPLVFKKKVNGASYSFSANKFGKIGFTISRLSSPGSRGSEVEESESSLLLGARYENSFKNINLKILGFKDTHIGFSFANNHKEKYDSPGTGIFRLNVDTDLSPYIYFMIADSDTSDGNGGQIFEIKYICYDNSGSIIREIHFHTPAQSGDADSEDDYLYYNNASIDNDHRFADMSAKIIYALPVPINTKKVHLIVKTGGAEKLYKISADNINYYTIDNSILPDNDYCNLIITEDSFLYDNSISIDSSSTYDDSTGNTGINFTLKNVLSSDIYNVAGNTAGGMDWKTKIIFPFIGEFTLNGEFAYSRERRIYYTEKRNIDGKAFKIKVAKEFSLNFGLFEVGTIQWSIDDKYNAGFSVDSRKDYNSIDFYVEGEGSGVPLGKEIDFNYNGVPDYTEGFYAIDSYQPIFIVGIDKNYNGILDKFEFSDKPDYGLDANQTGNEYYLWFSPFIELEMQLGRYYTKEYNGSKSLESYYLKCSYEKLFKRVIFFGGYNITSYVKKNLWVVDNGKVDGIDNDLDGYIDESDEVDAEIENEGLFDNSFVNRTVLVGRLKRLKGGLGAKIRIGSYYINNLDNHKKELQLGNSGLVDFKKSIFDITFYPFLKMTSIRIFESPYNVEKYYQSYIERNYGLIITYPFIKEWILKTGYINQLYDFNLNINDTKGSILLFEIVGKPVFSGRTMAAKLGVKKIITSNDLRGDVKESKFFIKLYFRM